MAREHIYLHYAHINKYIHRITGTYATRTSYGHEEARACEASHSEGSKRHAHRQRHIRATQALGTVVAYTQGSERKHAYQEDGDRHIYMQGLMGRKSHAQVPKGGRRHAQGDARPYTGTSFSRPPGLNAGFQWALEVEICRLIYQ